MEGGWKAKVKGALITADFGNLSLIVLRECLQRVEHCKAMGWHVFAEKPSLRASGPSNHTG